MTCPALLERNRDLCELPTDTEQTTVELPSCATCPLSGTDTCPTSGTENCPAC